MRKHLVQYILMLILAGGWFFATFAYTLGSAGNRTSLSETVNGVSRTFSWQYDPLYRLTNETISGTAPTGTISYKYDAVGNRTNRSSTVTGITNQTFSYNNNDWLTTDVYDNNGSTRTNGADTFQYDVECRLTNATVGGVSVACTYNADGIRVSKTTAGTTTIYLVDDRNPTGYAQVLEELTVSGGTTNLSKVYTYGVDLIAQREVGSGVRTFYSYDGNGNTRFLTTTNAAISDTYVYDAFGTLLASTGSTPNDYLFMGEQRDAILGLYYLRARYLNSAIGRFWSRDTEGVSKRDPRTLHRYVYCANQPADFIDPSGHDLNKLLPPSFQKIAKRAGIYAAVAIYVGKKAQEKIGQEYRREHGNAPGIWINSSIASVLDLAPGFDTDINKKLIPDIADARPGVHEVYEIKSGWIRALGDAVDSARHQADNYISVLNEASGSKPPGGAAVWRAGTSWNPEGIYSLDTLIPLRIIVSRPEPGVIIYEPTSEFYVYVLAGEIVPKAARAIAAYSRARMQQEIAAAPIFSLGLGF